MVYVLVFAVDIDAAENIIFLVLSVEFWIKAVLSLNGNDAVELVPDVPELPV